MSLLLDARKKSQQALSALDADNGHTKLELSLEEHPDKGAPETPLGATMADNIARNAGKNLFEAKSPAISYSRMGGINRNLLFALGGTVLLLAAGAGYLWYIDSAGSAPPMRPPIPATAAPPVSPAPITAAPENKSVAGSPAPGAFDSAARTRQANKSARRKMGSSPQSTGRISIQPKQTELLDPLINNAYLAYRGGRLNEARQMYLEVLGKDARNTDALLGLAAIAQLQAEDRLATQYYLRVLTLEPRNAVAHAGMSALNRDENNESRLKSLLREQRDSPALHFALGNIYSGQSRWGEAQSAYFNAYTLDPENAELAFNLAISLDHLGQNKLAVQFYQRALQLDLTGSNQPLSASMDRAKITQRVKELAR
ncbi:MAG: tetratricopeptide repeat protein [Pseudomonadota bacterium]